MCGIIAILLHDTSAAVNQELYDGMTVLQHRGQDAAGMVTCTATKRLHLVKDNGFVRDVFKLQHMIQLLGHYGIGHVRYPTAGASSNVHEAQPFVTNIPFGLCLCHNGNITNTAEIKEQLSVRYHFNTDSDSELLLSVLADELLSQEQSQREVKEEMLFCAVRGLMNRTRGGYAAIVLINGQGVLAFRDPHGIRPLCYGKRDALKGGDDWCIASESVGLQCLGYSLERDVAPGEAIFISKEGVFSSALCHDSPRLYPCVFEWVYFGRPDSVIDGASVYNARKEMGNFLADKISRTFDVSQIDVVVPVPETSRISALQCAIRLGIEYEEGLTKNRYIARTFIMPGQDKRRKNVRKKLNPVKSVFEGKGVLLVDDSIVRGTTSQEIVQMAREAGARQVFFCSASPAIRYANVYGIDMPVQSELIAYGREESDIARVIGADWVVYQDIEDMKRSITIQNPALVDFDCSCFDGCYVTGDINEEFFSALSQTRNDSALVAVDNKAIKSDVDQIEGASYVKKKAIPAIQSNLTLEISGGDVSAALLNSPQTQSAEEQKPADEAEEDGKDGQLPRGRQIAPTSRKHVTNSSVTNSNLELLSDRLSGWV